VRQSTREKDLDAFVRVADARVHDAEVLPVGSLVSRFLAQFPPRTAQQVFAGIDLAGRKFEKCPPQRIAILALEQQTAIGQHRHDHHRTGVADVLAQRFAAIRQSYPVTANLQEHPVIDLGRLELDFDQRVAFRVRR
jgi:hypothetical protein